MLLSISIFSCHEGFLLFCHSFKLAVCWLWGLTDDPQYSTAHQFIFLPLRLQISILLCSHLTYMDVSEVLYTFPTGSASDGCCPPKEQSRSSMWQMEGSRPPLDLCNSAEGHTKDTAQSFVHPALRLGGSKSHTSILIHQILCPATPFVSQSAQKQELPVPFPFSCLQFPLSTLPQLLCMQSLD